MREILKYALFARFPGSRHVHLIPGLFYSIMGLPVQHFCKRFIIRTCSGPSAPAASRFFSNGCGFGSRRLPNPHPL